jgi:hypothetical protein
MVFEILVIQSSLWPVEYKEFFISWSMKNRRRNLGYNTYQSWITDDRWYLTYRWNRPRFAIGAIERINCGAPDSQVIAVVEELRS